MAQHPPDSNLTQEQGQLLVKLAKTTISKELGRPVQDMDELDRALSQKPFDMRCGTFVTLNKNGQLRGCIGSLTDDEAISQGVRHNAVNAAFHDPRFPPLSQDELDQIQVEVSVLSEPQPLVYRDAQDLLTKLRVDVDGVILGKGFARATFLPQVWEQLPNPKDFLTHLCRKAGLPGNAWENTKLDISTYQVEYFEEH